MTKLPSSPPEPHTGKGMGAVQGLLRSALAVWVNAAMSAAAVVIALALLAAGSALYYTATHLGFNTDTTDMLSRELPFRRHHIAYQEAFPYYNETLVIVIDGDTVESAQSTAEHLAAHLRRRRDLFKTVYLPGESAFFQRHGLLYSSPAELEDLADNLAQVQPFLARLIEQPNLNSLFSTLGAALEAEQEGEARQLNLLLQRLDAALQAILENHHYALSWQEIMNGKPATVSDRRRFIIVQPVLDYQALQPAEPAIHALRQLLEAQAHGVRVRLTGWVAIAYEELQSVNKGFLSGALITLCLVSLVLFMALRAWQLMLATLSTLLIGLALTAGFATLAVGHLNLISIAFAVLYIGLSVDYAIHFCLRYRELRKQGDNHTNAIRHTVTKVGGSLTLCALTTALGFYAFLPTDFVGVSELGLISGTGMLISLTVSLTLLPALLTIMPPLDANRLDKPNHPTSPLIELPQRYSRLILAFFAAASLGAAILLPQSTFDFNTLNLKDPTSESVATFNDLLAESATSPWSIVVLAANQQNARQLKNRLESLDVVFKALIINDFIPSQQDEKRFIIEEIAWLLGGITQKNPNQINMLEQVAGLREFQTVLERFLVDEKDSILQASANSLFIHLSQFLDTLPSHDPASQTALLRRLENALLGSLPGQWKRLKEALKPNSVTLEILPKDLLERWVTQDGRYRIEVWPEKKLENNADLKQFVAAVHRVAPQATEEAAIVVAAGQAVVTAFVEAFCYALVAISVLLFILFRHKGDILLVLIPLLLAGIFTGASSVVLAIPFNFANVIALPLLLGMGIDSSIHMLHRFRQFESLGTNLLATSTARAVFYSTLTTLCSFGTLAFSAHPGTASMGQLLTIGLIMTLVCTLILLPALLQRAAHGPKPLQPP